MSDKGLIQQVFAPVIGLPAWNVKKGIGSFITFQFGIPSLEVREPVSSPNDVSLRVAKQLKRRVIGVIGEWSLWIYCCNWCLYEEVEQLAFNESSDEQIDSATSFLDGQILRSIEVNPRDATSIFRFDLGGKLTTWPTSQEAEQWLLYEQTKDRVLTYRGDGLYNYAQASASEEEAKWL